MSIEPITGRYLTITVEGAPRRIYFEEAGQGRPVLCLHTAGSDTRQWRHLLNDREITASNRLIAFDMPWHGKSLPPEGFETEEYLLTTEGYIETVLAVADGLGLDRPVLAGCSMGGRIALQIAALYPDDSPASSRSKPRTSSPRGTTSTGSTVPTRMAARWARRSSRPTSRPTLRPRTAGARSGCSCRAVRASSAAT
jgi:pimeloyl-ACP methyl ester carboxylesterase